MLLCRGVDVLLTKCCWERKKGCSEIMAEERMELFIETLTGAAFELKVSPFETIVSIKAKIQYLEGIPVSQQHLIWRSQELLDDYCLHDYCITDGATLKLVLGMRGGPINTRQVPSENKKLKDLADYVEKRSETAASSGRPLTVLVFHDGDKVHMYTLLERGECSVTPLSGSISETSSISSTKNVDEEEDAQWRIENEQTREKMLKLQEQIKALNLNKPKKKQRSPSNSVAAPHSGKSSSSDACSEQLKLPPLLRSSTAQGTAKSQRQAIRLNSENVDPKADTIEKSVFSRWVAATGSTAVIGNEETNKWDLEPGANEESYDVTADGAEKDPSASSSPKLKLNSISSPLLTLPEEVAKTPEGDCPPTAPSADKVSTPDTELEKESSFLPYLSQGQLQGAQNVDKKQLFNFSAQNASLIALGVNSINSPYRIVKYGPSKHKDPYRHLSVTSNQALATQRFLDLDHWIDNRPKTTPQGNLYRPLDSIVEGGVWGSIGSVHGHRPKKKGKSKHPLSVSLPSNKLNPLTRLPENSDVRWNMRSSSSMLKNRTGITRNHTKMGIGTLIASGTRVLKSSSTKVSDTSENLVSPPFSPSNKTTSKTTKEGSRPNSGQKLPPIKTKKRTYKRCSWCNKRTGLATSYSCRCNKNFCAAHRYAELHHCSFDYKTEGRRLLQQNNPVVKAPKLPKI